jgi:MtaA/CmuA family methyltransferase
VNSFERMQKRLRGEPVDRPPNFDILMGLAAHRLGKPLRSFYLDHHVLVEANLAALEAFDLDILQAISDPYREAADFGLEVDFPDDNLPVNRQPLLKEPQDLKKLKPPDPSGGRRMSDRVEAVRLFHEQAGGRVPVMGWVEGALAEAADLRSVYLTMTDLVRRPAWLEELLEICCQVEIAFARAQVAAGADLIGLGDAVASQVSPAMYRRFALPYEQRIFAAVHEMGAVTRLHICGNTSRLLPDMLESGADILDLDWMVDLGAAAAQSDGRVALLGNIDPVAVLLQGSPAQVERATRDCRRAGGLRWICGAGCEVPDGTPPENLLAQRDALKMGSEEKVP